MPELPEVETVVRTLRPRLLGAAISAVWTSNKGLRLARPIDRAALARLSVAARIAAVRRKGKYILIDLDRGQAGVLIHLGMSGRLRLQAGSEPRAPHTHVVWSLAGGDELRFVDPRRFGWVAASRDVDALPELAGLGPDALVELDVSRLRALLAASRAPLKSFLLDQKRIAGLGNIYVCEALFRARLHPGTPARRATGRAAALLRAIRATLRVALSNREPACATSSTPRAEGARTRQPCWYTAASANRVALVARPCAGRWIADARPSSVLAASVARRRDH